jgi:hypothetical protein
MTTKTYGATPAVGWTNTGSPLDKGALRLFGCFIKNINMNMGWGESPSTCDITLIEEFDINGVSLYKEPLLGQAVRIAIPNDERPNEPDYSTTFIGIVDSFENNYDGSGKTKTLKLKCLKEILKNIPIYLERVTSSQKSKLEAIPNFTYAYKNYNVDDQSNWEGSVWEDDAEVTFTQNKKGLIIKAIKEEVESKTYTFFKYDNNNFQQYSINMDSMFSNRIYGKSLTNKLTTGVYTTASFEGNEENIGIDTNSVSFDSSEGGRICSYYFRISGTSKSLSEVIEEAMAGNACDWYVYAYEKGHQYSLETKAIKNEIVIKIIPIPRNDFDNFTTKEFDSFVNSLESVLTSKKYGKELNNAESNKIFLGANKEYLYRCDATKFLQFWGFKKEPNPTKVDEYKIIDKYGKTISLLNGINLYPTFDTSPIPKINITDGLYSHELLCSWLSRAFGYDVDTIKDYNNEKLIELIEENSTFEKSYIFNTSKEFEKTEFEILANSIKDQDMFYTCLESIANYVDYYEKYCIATPYSYSSAGLSNFSSIGVHGATSNYWATLTGKDYYIDTSSDIKNICANRFSSVKICGRQADPGAETPKISMSYSGKFTISFTHTLNIEELHYGNLVTGEFDLSKEEDVLKFSKQIKPTVEVYFGETLISSNILVEGRNISITFDESSLKACFYKDKNNKNGYYYISQGLCFFKILVRMYIYNSDNEAIGDGVVEDQIVIPLDYNGYNIYKPLKDGILYEWAKKTCVKLLKTGLQDINDPAMVFKSSKEFSPKTKNKSKAIVNFNNQNIQIFQDRFEQLYEIVKGYVDEYKDKKFYRKITNRNWEIIDSAWDGKTGVTIQDPVVRGKFIDKNNGKMPCLYYVKNANFTKVTNHSKDILFTFSDGKNAIKETLKTPVSLYGRASCSMYAVGRDMENESEDTRYAIVELENVPEFKNQEMGAVLEQSFIKTYEDALAWDAAKEYIKYMNEIRRLGFSGNIALATTPIPLNFELKLKIIPKYYYIPLRHEYERYGPWILDGRTNENSRSRFGQTNCSTDNDLCPWEFKDTGEIQDYIEYQYGNCLTTEYRFNRGVVSCADIPRYNMGFAIGKFANISSININYGADGITTTYSFATVGASDRAKEERKTQQMYKMLKNVASDVRDIQNIISSMSSQIATGDSNG